MQYRRIPNTDLNVSLVGLGTWVTGGENWGQTKKQDALDAIATAIDHGVNLIDTAPVYGYGRAEELVGQAIGHCRDKVLLATKCGLVNDGKNIRHNLQPESIKAEVELSLGRLKTDVIDLYQCHWPDSNTPIEETMAMLCKLKAQGKIRYIGLSNFDKALFLRAKAVGPVDSYQGQYSLLAQYEFEDVVSVCQQEGLGFLAYGVLGGGILTGKYDVRPKFYKSDARQFFYPFYKEENFNRVTRFIDMLRDTNYPLSQLAINWVLKNPIVISALVGCRNRAQVMENIAAVDWSLTTKDVEQIEKHYENWLEIK